MLRSTKAGERWSRAAVLVVVLLLSACGTSRTGVDADAEQDATEALVDRLNEAGIETLYEGSDLNTFLTQRAEVYYVRGGDLLFVHEYASEASAYQDTRRIRLSGYSNPSVYHRDNVIVVHIGADSQVRSVLTDALGARIF